MWKYKNTQGRKTYFLPLNHSSQDQIHALDLLNKMAFSQFGLIASPLLQLPYYHQLEIEKIHYHRRLDRGFKSCFIHCLSSYPFPLFFWFSLYSCSFAQLLQSHQVTTVLTLNSYMKSFLPPALYFYLED